MGIWNRFKKEKEQEVGKGAKAVKVSDSKKEKKTEKKVTKAAKETKTTKAVKGTAAPESLEKLILKPYITEKSAILAHDDQYVFVVDARANRIQVRNAVKAMYGVTPVRVNVQNYAGKRVRFGRIRGKQKNWKKAIVTLPKGTKIDVYEGV